MQGGETVSHLGRRSSPALRRRAIRGSPRQHHAGVRPESHSPQDKSHLRPSHGAVGGGAVLDSGLDGEQSSPILCPQCREIKALERQGLRPGAGKAWNGCPGTPRHVASHCLASVIHPENEKSHSPHTAGHKEDSGVGHPEPSPRHGNTDVCL